MDGEVTVVRVRGENIPLMTSLRCCAESVSETARIRRGFEISIFSLAVLIVGMDHCVHSQVDVDVDAKCDERFSGR